MTDDATVAAPEGAPRAAGAVAPPPATLAPARVSRPRAYAPVMATALVLALVPLALGGSRHYLGLATLALVYAAYAVGFNIVFGSTGQLFLCMGALAGIGAYGAAVLGNELEVPVVLGTAVSVAVAALLGAVFSWVAVRRRLDVIFVGIITLAFSLVFHNLLLGQRDLTGGETGIVVAAQPPLVSDRGLPSYYLLLAVLVAYLAVHRWLQRSHVGWAFAALRDDEMAAELAGIDVTRYKVLAGVVGAAMVALVGALYAHYEGFVSPTTFETAQVDIPVLVMLAFGGIGSLLGPVIGAAVFTMLDEWLRPLSTLRTTVYGVVLLALFLGFRRGVAPAVTGLVRRFARRA